MSPADSSPVRAARVALLAAAAIAGAAILHWFPPGTSGFYPVCLLHRLTGLDCAGCGATRAAYHLVHGHLLLALRHNALFILALPAIGLWTVRSLRPWIRGGPLGSPGFTARGAMLAMALMGAFTVVRNLPFAPCRWLAAPPAAALARGPSLPRGTPLLFPPQTGKIWWPASDSALFSPP
jgi:hypothetical protein